MLCGSVYGSDGVDWQLGGRVVSITLTPVNDAPVVADVQASTAEDTALVIALGDVDRADRAGSC